MSGAANNPADFSARLKQAMEKAKAGATSASAASSTISSAAGAAPVDEFSKRINAAMARAGGKSASDADTAPQEQSGGPVGAGDHVVKPGECMSSIAFKHGHFWETLWNDPPNSELKEVRKDPYVLLPGDRVTIMELRRKDETIAPEQRHRFKRKGCPEKLVLEFKNNGVPLANMPYVLEVDGVTSEGASDSNGRVEVLIPPDAREGKIRFPDVEEEYELELGHLQPITEIGGVQGRLRNLGFYEGPIDGEINDDLRRAIKAFQSRHELELTGEADEKTRAELVAAHGS